ncbi:ImmA/IrrE family metallo-endopeptidase [Kribbella sp. CA-294648]|uniref:ImmA/IrrE family metallo-endopeptidase n=1 Tax=Kribbella sp. CA-294648 TaxID=3239948 RepID=UPI003D93A787
MGRMNVSAEVLHTVLTQEVRKANSGAEWARWLDTAAQFPTYGFGNAVLINLQMPQANFIAAAPGWERLGRRVVKSGAIKILAPVRSRVLFEDKDGELTMDPQGSIRQGIIGFKVANVWDVAHTVGPRTALSPTPLPPTIDGLWESLIRDAYAKGYTIDVGPRTAEIDGYTDHRARQIIISNQLDTLSVIGRLAHEVGHLRMHSAAPGEARACRGLAEIEADSFAHIALAHYGRSTRMPSFEEVMSRAVSEEPRSPESVIKAVGTRAVIAARRFLESTGHQVAPPLGMASRGISQDTDRLVRYSGPEL